MSMRVNETHVNINLSFTSSIFPEKNHYIVKIILNFY